LSQDISSPYISVMTPADSVLVAQLTDTHLFADADQRMRGVNTARSLQAVLEAVRSLPRRPDLLLLTGDLSQDETEASYQRLWEGLAPFQVPTYWIPGNHDNSATMQPVLEQAPFSGTKCFQQGGWNFVLLNSAIANCVEGKLSSASLDWLEAALQRYPEYPTVVALHHPPAEIGSEWMDEISLRNPADLYDVIDRHPQVKLVVFGHIHQAFAGQRQGVGYLGTPSTCIQFKPLSRELAVDEVQPGFRLLQLNRDGSYMTTVQRATHFVADSEPI
jgi:3',5'-cyclic-AMP phosphodiesterase